MSLDVLATISEDNPPFKAVSTDSALEVSTDNLVSKEPSANVALEASVDKLVVKEPSAELALEVSADNLLSKDVSAEALATNSVLKAASLDNTYVANAWSFSVSTELIKATISANWSASAVEADKIASIRPFSLMIAPSKDTSAEPARLISADKPVFKEASADDVIAALQGTYGHFKALNKKAVVEALMTAEANGLLEETRFEMDSKNELRVYYHANEEGAATINKYIKD